ncbi:MULTISPECIES: hypothetical protein [unclassified Nostoc]|uniref:hypothetical protein n=1 Tax=unclassified Nostoc TaxID=2593658 RepID=UPI001C616A5A
MKSRSSLKSSSNQYLGNLAKAVEKHPGWRFEFSNDQPGGYNVFSESRRFSSRT